MARATKAQTDAAGFDIHELLEVLVTGLNPDGTAYTLPVEAQAQSADWHQTATGAANAVATTTKTSAAGLKHCLSHATFALSGSPTGTPYAKISLGGVEIWRAPMTGGTLIVPFPVPLKTTAVNHAITASIDAPGIGISGIVSISGFSVAG